MPRPEDVVLQEMDKFMDKFIDRVFQLSQQNLVNDKKIDTGTLLKTGNINRSFLNKEIVYPVPYADVVEFGRTAGTPMYSGWLHKWVRRKLGITNEAEIKRISFAIAKSIEQRGIDPSPYLRPAADQTKQEMKL